jgi:hypothetical protein
LGFIIKWFGGYPVKNMQPEYDSILNLIEAEFFKLAPDKNTPEIAFCTADITMQKKMREIEILLNAQMENGKIVKNSSFYHKVDNDLNNLPGYVRKWILHQFEHLINLRSDQDYIDWQNSLQEFIEQVPQEQRKEALEKAIKYGEDVLDYHIKNECPNPSDCKINESLNRRLTLAKAVLAKEYPIESKSTNDVEVSEQNSRKTELTLTRQVLAFHYLFQHLNVSDIDFTEKARFIQFITGRETNSKTIGSTNIYKRIKSPLQLDDNNLIKDLQFVRNYYVFWKLLP